MAWHLTLALLACATVVRTLDAPSSYVLHEERSTAPSGRWVRRDRVRSSGRFMVRIGLVQSNLDVAHEYLMDVADPKSANYGKHWTPDRVIDTFKPGEDTVEAVRTWLNQSGVTSITHSDNKAWFAFYETAEKMESLLHAEFWEFYDTQTGGIIPACDRYYIPEHLHKHIDFITPGIKLIPSRGSMRKCRRKHARKQKAANLYESRSVQLEPRNLHSLKHCDEAISPACIAALYDIPEPAHLADPSNSMGIFEEGLQYWNQQDLDSFFALYAPWIPNGTHPKDNLIDGAVAETPNPIDDRLEVMLDLEMAYPIIYPQKISIWDDDDLHYQSEHNDTYTWGFNTFLDAIDGSYCTACAYGECGDLKGVDPTYPDPAPNGYKGHLQCGVFKPTNVVSFSYGGVEAEVPIAYQKRQCNEFLKLGLQGVSLIFSSGDNGVGGSPLPGHEACLGPQQKIFSPSWPCNCPWVTNVGATQVFPGKTVFEPESAATDQFAGGVYSSGGGFSNVYPAPAYQRSALQAFFANHDPPYSYYSGLVEDSKDVFKKPDVAALAGSSNGVYNRIGRGIPDVAANGFNGDVVFENGVALPAGSGTSMSAPIFAAIINRINEERISCGKSVLGFLNPALYAHPDVLNDITNGTNPNCGTSGFSAVHGWDPVTGLGTPNYPRMLNLFMSLP